MSSKGVIRSLRIGLVRIDWIDHNSFVNWVTVIENVYTRRYRVINGSTEGGSFFSKIFYTMVGPMSPGAQLSPYMDRKSFLPTYFKERFEGMVGVFDPGGNEIRPAQFLRAKDHAEENQRYCINEEFSQLSIKVIQSITPDLITQTSIKNDPLPPRLVITQCQKKMYLKFF